MAQAEALVLFSSLLTLCVSTGSPEVWVQVQRGPTELPSFLVRCGVSTSSPISLVTVSREGFVDAGGTKLAVLHPEHGSQEWAPTSQARWETSNSIALTVTLEQSEQSLDNATFCCEFVTFPLGVRAACGDLHGSEPAPAPVLQAVVAGILGTLGFLLFGFILVLCLLCRRQRRWCFSSAQPSLTGTQARTQAQLSRLASARGGSFISTENRLYA
ncbi:transmembrane protein PVRIG isoform X3 [Meriones unguiculatus]|uniref:transmembrane protein PVRIG isoform X3 n=1 Tax=Meriones unguiculatus TaxID=10047 RepID=UPI00293EA5C1|nr:transmembrane protein PVRIG isoform X3 [Meriones unguiculatus]